MADRTLTVKIVGDDRALKRTFTSSSTAVRGFERDVTKMNQSARGALSGFGSKSSLLFGSGAFIGTAGISAALKKSVSAASDLNEQISKSRQVFGDSSKEIEAWSETTARSIGISQRAAISATGTFGNLFRVVGLAPSVAGGMSQALVQLAADLASFNNASPEDVLIALRSGLIGEAEPLRRYGVLLSEARVQQEALAATGKTNVKALTDQEKALARYQIILRDTASAQGDFARTQGGLANQSRVLTANVDDLSARLGGVLVPALTDVARLANLAANGLQRISQIKILPVSPGGGGTSAGDVFGWVSGWKELHFLLGVIEGDMAKLDATTASSTSRGEGRRAQDVVVEAAARAAVEREKAIKEAKARLTRSRDAFSAFTKGMGLKLDKAGLTDSLGDDIAVLRELERAILRQIEREGKTFKLVEQLTSTRLALASLVEEQAVAAAQKASDAFNNTLDALGLKLDIAQTTKSFADDTAALNAIEKTILKRIEQEGRTTELLQRLFDVRQQQADVRRQIAERAKAQRQSKQFEEIGLTSEGDKRTPGKGALLRRVGNLQEQIKGTILDTPKTRAQLANIVQVLAGKFGEAGKTLRAAILGMLNDISDALDSDKKKGPLTKFKKRGIESLIEGIGLSETETKEIRQRLSQQGPGGTAPTKGAGAFGFATANGTIIVESHVFLDGKEIAVNTTKRQQKQRGRGGSSRRGVRAGGIGGV